MDAKNKQSVYCLLAALSKGGMERQMIVLMKELLQRGYNVTLVTISARKDMYSCDNRINRVRLAKDGMNKLAIFKAMWTYFHKEVEDDSVIISFGTIINLFGILSTIGKRIKFIAGERNLTIKETMVDKMAYSLYKRVNYIVPNSYSQKSYLEHRIKKFKGKITTITNFTDTDYFTPQLDLLNKESVRVISVFARIHPQKNLLGFAKAIKYVIDLGYKEFRVDWYGATSAKEGKLDKYHEQAKRLINELGIDKYLRLHAPIMNVPEVINYSDAICLPSYKEGFSNSISEAICCGKIVLASDISDNGVMVENNVNGFLFDPNDTSSMASSIIKYLKLDEYEVQSMSHASREKALSLFNLKRFGDQYEELINDNNITSL